MERRDVEDRLNRAMRRLTEQDRYLLENNLSERCIAARLALHLQPEFPDHKVDVEYNRKGGDPKRLQISEDCANAVDDDGNAFVVPDIIVHQRGQQGPNILVLELKKTTNPAGAGCDRERVLAFRAEMHYEFGALIECETRPRRGVGIRIAEWIGN